MDTNLKESHLNENSHLKLQICDDLNFSWELIKNDGGWLLLKDKSIQFRKKMANEDLGQQVLLDVNCIFKANISLC